MGRHPRHARMLPPKPWRGTGPTKPSAKALRQGSLTAFTNLLKTACSSFLFGTWSTCCSVGLPGTVLGQTAETPSPEDSPEVGIACGAACEGEARRSAAGMKAKIPTPASLEPSWVDSHPEMPRANGSPQPVCPSLGRQRHHPYRHVNIRSPPDIFRKPRCERPGVAIVKRKPP